MTYNPICKQQGLTIGTGTVVIVTGWKPVEAIARLLKPHQYAAIGNLYSPAGVDYFVRNILANPHVTGVLALRLTKQDENSGSIAALKDFFGSPTASIEGIPQEDIERVRSLPFVTLLETSTIPAALDYLRKKSPLGGEPRYYYPKVIESEILPGSLYGHRIEGKTIADTWVSILHRIRTTGRESPSGYGVRQELIDLMAVVTDEPEDFNVPDWLPVDRAFLNSYYPQLLEDAPVGVKYTYGSRLRSHFGVDQIEQCVSKLAGELDAASAVMTLWDVQDHVKGGSPCLNHIWMRVIDGALSLTATFRSNDMFDAWCANAFGLRKLQQHVRDRLAQETGQKLTLAPLITVSQSAHIYDHSYAYADEVIAEKFGKNRKEFNDPIGNFEIVVEQGQVLVSRMIFGGAICKQYCGIEPSKLMEEIIRDAPAILPSHTAYLAFQLTKAKESLESGETWKQE